MDNLKIEAEKEAQIILNYFKAEDYISAEVKAKKLIKKFPNYQAVYNLLGLCLQSQKKFSEAMWLNFCFSLLPLFMCVCVCVCVV